MCFYLKFSLYVCLLIKSSWSEVRFNYLKRLFEFHAKPAEFLGFSVNVFLFKVLIILVFNCFCFNWYTR